MTAADAGGAAPAPQAVGNGGPPPLTAADLPDEIAAQLPDGFVLPPGFAFVQIPEPTPEEQAAGNAEHAAMLHGVYQAAQDDLARLAEHHAGQLEAAEAGVAQTRDDWLAAEERLQAHASQHGIELPPRPGDGTEPGPDPAGVTDGGGQELWRSAPSPRSSTRGSTR